MTEVRAMPCQRTIADERQFRKSLTSSLPWEQSYYRFNYRREKLSLERNPWLAQLSWLREIQVSGSVSELIYATQFTHAQGLKYWLEYLRSLKYHCGGMLYWKFNDPSAPNREDMSFPSLMACIDSWGVPKLAYYYARRAYEDQLLAFQEDLEGNLHIYGCNETDESPEGELTVSVKTYGGETLWSHKTHEKLTPDASVSLLTLTAQEIETFPAHSCYVSARLAGENLCLKNIFHLTEIGEWNQVTMKKATLQAQIKVVEKDRMEITIVADAFVQDVTMEILNQDVFYSDNGFCLEEGERALICAYLPADFNGRGTLRIRAWQADDLCLSFMTTSL